MGYNEQIESAVLQLQVLQGQFNLVLNQYKQAYASYTYAIENNSNATAQVYLGHANTLNATLSQLYSQIQTTLQHIEPAYMAVENKNAIESSDLNKVNMSLLEEKHKINQLLADYETLEHVQNDTSLKLESNHMYYRIFFIIAIIVIVLLVKQLVNYKSSSSEMRGGGNKSTYNLLFNFILMILLLLLAMVFKQSAGFILWALIVLAYILVKIRVLPNFQ